MTTQVPYQLLSPDAQAALTAFRNKIINADFRVNQRGYASGAPTSGANQYTLDRWRVVTSGQAIAFTSLGNVVTVTAPAGGMEQVIEGNNLVTGTHTLSWTGTATATVGGTAVPKGSTVAVTGGSNLTIRFAGGTVSNVQFEPGTVATPFEQRHFGFELALCQRYFERGAVPVQYLPINTGNYFLAVMVAIFFKVTKRTTSYVMNYTGVQIYASGSVVSYTGSLSTVNVAVEQCALYLTTAVVNNNGTAGGAWTCEAEL
jgi:hypothetical protein